MTAKNKSRASRLQKELRRFKHFQAWQHCVLTRPSPEQVAAMCKVTVTTAKRWLSGNRRIPYYAQLLIAGDLGAVSQDWKGWRLERDTIISPKGYALSRSEVESAYAMNVELVTLREQLEVAVKYNRLEEQPGPDD